MSVRWKGILFSRLHFSYFHYISYILNFLQGSLVEIWLKRILRESYY